MKFDKILMEINKGLRLYSITGEYKKKYEISLFKEPYCLSGRELAFLWVEIENKYGIRLNKVQILSKDISYLEKIVEILIGDCGNKAV